MRCIFCKSSDSPFTSIEHIIPESIGNKEHILPKGIVCDICNNYFSRKVENKFINSDAIRYIRNQLEIKNKDNRVPNNVEVSVDKPPKLPDQRIVSRFLGKVAIEALALRAINANVSNWEIDVIDNAYLDDLRNLTRFDNFKGDWPFHYRTLHPADATFISGKVIYQMLHIYDFLYTKQNEIYLVISIFGAEFAINIAGPALNGYMEWLRENNFKSYLYENLNI